MTIIAGSQVLATDYTAIAGTTSSLTAYASVSAAATKLAALYGVGYGDRGYGQTIFQIPSIQKHTLISGSDWTSLLGALEQCAIHTGVNLPLPDPANYTSGSLITAVAFDWLGAAQLMDTNRLNYPATAIPFTAITSVRTTRWTGSPYLEVVVDFSTEDRARYFFNSGSQITINASITGGTNAQTASWSNLLNTCGTIRLSAHNVTQTGSGGITGSNGYYELGSSPTVLFTQNDIGTYAVNYVSLMVGKESYQGIHGANGSKIRLIYKLVDAYGGSMDFVDGTLTVNLGFVTSGGTISVTAPIATLVTGVDAGGDPPYYQFNDVLYANTLQYNVLSSAQAAGYDPLTLIPLRANVTVLAGVYCGSQDPAIPAFTIPSLVSDSLVTIYNNGYILGKGGDGGLGKAWAAGTPGQAGGDALNMASATKLYNNGLIGGGGGGGGGSSNIINPETYDDPGGGGGGGAGYPIGIGGYNSYGQASNGGTTSGGAGQPLAPHGNSKEWYLAFAGGNGGNLGEDGIAGQGQFAFGTGGPGGRSMVGTSYLQAGSNWGDYRGATTA